MSAMKKIVFYTCLVIICVALIAVLIMINYQSPLPTQGVFSSGTGQEENAIHLSLIDTGVYYLMTPSGKEIESGAWQTDENGVYHLCARDSDESDIAKNAFFLPTGHARFTLILDDGRTMMMKKIDNGGRVPAHSSNR